MDAIKQALMERMTGAEMITYLGKPVITWKAPKPNYRIDIKRLALENPNLIEVYQSLIQSSRRFVVKDLPKEILLTNVTQKKSGVRRSEQMKRDLILDLT